MGKLTKLESERTDGPASKNFARKDQYKMRKKERKRPDGQARFSKLDSCFK